MSQKKKSKLNFSMPWLKSEPKETKMLRSYNINNKLVTIRTFYISRKEKTFIINQLRDLRKKIKQATRSFKLDSHLQAVITPLVLKMKEYRYLLKQDYHIGFTVSYKTQKIIEYYPGYAKLSKSLMSALIDTRIYVREMRQSNQRIKHYFKTVKGNQELAYSMVRFVHQKEGDFLRLNNIKKVYTIFDNKIPKSKTNYVGVEIEFCAKVDKIGLAQKLMDAGLLEYCAWKKDDSLRPKDAEHAHELAILSTETKIPMILKRIGKVLTEVGATTENRRCGLHVHLDCRNRDKELVFNNLVASQNVLMKMSDPLRRNGEFCRRVPKKSFPRTFSGETRERYKTVNASAYYRHKTIEVRILEGTVDTEKIINWIKLLVKIASYKEKVPKSISTINKLAKQFELDDNLKTYIRDSINFWDVQSRHTDMFEEFLTELNRPIITVDTQSQS